MPQNLSTMTVSTAMRLEEPASRDDHVRIERMFEHHFDAVWRALKRLGAPDPDDAAQRVFIVAAKRLSEIHVAGERAYLMGIAMRIASNARVSVERRREVALEVLPATAAPGALPDEVLARRRAQRTVLQILESMPEEMREAFVLFELNGLTAPEVAEILAVPVGTVASRVRRAREHFRQRVEEIEERDE
jgi:RNA polymerase sigma-70 factor (ECF subfamily)